MIPWALGVNGFFSVISTALALILSIELGFKWVWLLAAVAYMIPLFLYKGISLPRAK